MAGADPRPPSTPPGHAEADSAREVVLITGISGSGKSVALHALEDAGFFCVDNLPPELLRGFLQLGHRPHDPRVAIAVDVRSAGSLPHLLPLIKQLHEEGVRVRSIFLDASTDALVRRFSETRRPHPLSQAPDWAGRRSFDRSDEDLGYTRPGGLDLEHAAAPDGHRALIDAIELERELLADLREVSTVIDTSQLRPAQLRVWIRGLMSGTGNRLTLVFESFAFKHGVPLDADYVFDVRVLPNPHYVPELRPQNGRDPAVAAYLEAQPDVTEMLGQIDTFLTRWLPAFNNDQRSYLTVAIGCTGGQHRSVYFVEMLARRFARRTVTLIRHRELDARD